MAETQYPKVEDPEFGKRIASREIDVFIDQKIFGHEIEWALRGSRQMPFRKGWHDFGMPFSVPYYHEKMSDTWLIVEELRKRGLYLILNDTMSQYRARFWDQTWKIDDWVRAPDPERTVWTSTAEMTICLAALLAIGEDWTDHPRA